VASKAFICWAICALLLQRGFFLYGIFTDANKIVSSSIKCGCKWYLKFTGYFFILAASIPNFNPFLIFPAREQWNLMVFWQLDYVLITFNWFCFPFYFCISNCFSTLNLQLWTTLNLKTPSKLLLLFPAGFFRDRPGWWDHAFNIESWAFNIAVGRGHQPRRTNGQCATGHFMGISGQDFELSTLSLKLSTLDLELWTTLSLRLPQNFALLFPWVSFEDRPGVIRDHTFQYWILDFQYCGWWGLLWKKTNLLSYFYLVICIWVSFGNTATALRYNLFLIALKVYIMFAFCLFSFIIIFKFRIIPDGCQCT